MNKFLHVTCKRVYALALAVAMVLTTVLSDGTISLQAASGVEFSEAAGYEEGAYAEWAPVSGADGYKAYVSKDGGAYKAVDNELIREYANYWRVDAVGLAAGNYKIKVEAVKVNSNKEVTSVVASAETGSLTVTNYDRSGFAFSSESTLKSGSGAYNDDGTLKSNAQVIYVTAETAKTVTATVNGTTVTGIQAILDAKQKANTSNDVLCFRIIGCVTKSDLDKISSSSEGIQIKGKSSYTPMNITIEGIGEDATVHGYGFLIRNCGNIEFRNFGIMCFMDDGISLDTDNCNIWIHDMDFFYGSTGGDSDQAKGDGTVDLKGDSQWLTISYNHFWDSGKSSLCGMKSESGPNYITYHHNWFDHTDSRCPRIRTMSVHVYNNFYDGVSKYGVGAAMNSEAFVEANYFENTHLPMLSSMQGNDVTVGEGIFSGENGGIIKAYNNVIKNATALTYQNADATAANGATTAANATEFDAYLVSSRSENVPSSVKAKQGGKTYSNFDTKMDLGVAEADIDAPEDVPTIVKEKAGRVNGGDFKWDALHTDASQDKNYGVITELKAAVVAYKPSVKTIGGIAGVSGGGDNSSDSTEAPTENSTATTESGSTTPSQPSTEGKKMVLNVSTDLTASASIESNIEVNGFTVVASAAKKVAVDESKKSLDGVSYTQRLKLSGTGSTTERCIKFATTGAATVNVVAMSSNKASDRPMVLASATATIGTSTASGTTLAKHTYKVNEAGTYYLYSGDSGINIYYVEVIQAADATQPSTEAPTEASSEPVAADGDIYVAPNGKSTAAGTKADPMDFATALTKIAAGKTIWMMDGTYNYTTTIVIEEANSGTAKAYKNVRAINANKAIVDFTGMEELSSNRGIVLDGAYWHFYGVDICNAGDNGMLLSGDNNIIEMCQFYNNHDSGLQLSRYNTSYATVAEWPSNNLIKNCTAFNNKDEKTTENADGFAAKLTCGEGNVFDGCIAFCNCDDGWDLYAKPATGSIGVVTIKNCVAFGNGKTTDGTGSAAGDMNGFKLGGSNGACPTPHIIENCLAFNNGATGFTDNGNGGAIVMSNCTAANNGAYAGKSNFTCYRTSSSAVYSNLLTFAAKTSSETDYFKGKLDNVLYFYKSTGYYWVDSYQAGGTKEKYTGSEAKDYTVSASDFVSTTVPGYTASGNKYDTNYHTVFRNADGSINLNGLFELKQTSPLRKAANDGGVLGADFTKKADTPSTEPSTEPPTEPSTEASSQPSTEPGTEGKKMVLNVSTDLTASTISTNTEVNGFTVLASAAKTVVVDGSKKSLDGVSYTQRLKLGGTGSTTARSVKFATTGAATVNVIAMSSSSSANRPLVLASATATIGTQTVSGTAFAKYTYTVDTAGTYYLYSGDSGINIYYIEVIPQTGATEPSTETPTEVSTEAPTEASTEAPTEPSTEAPTEASTEAPTEPSTEAPSEPDIETPTGVEVTNVGGWNEMIFMEISGVKDADVTGVSYSGPSTGKLEGEDFEYLVRDYNGGVRIDILAIKAGTYTVTVNTKKGTITTSGIEVNAQDRSGYAHFNYTEGVGAYKDDGTLKDNAIVIYVTDATKNAVTLNYNGITVSGIGNILNSVGQACGEPGHENECKKISGGKTYYGKANTNQGIIKTLAEANVPLVVRFIGTVSDSGLYTQGTFAASSASLIEGLTAYDGVDYGGSTGDNGHMARMKSGKNITLEGIGTDAVIDGWGFHFMAETSAPELGKSFEVRNLTFINTPEDAIGMEGTQGVLKADGSVTGASSTSSDILGSVERCWVHNCEFYCPSISGPAESDKAEGDGSVDFKRGMYFTCSYNYFEGCHKTNLVGSSDSSLQFNLTYHHNYWKNCGARGPLARNANIHMYNNVYEGQTQYAMNPRATSYIFSEYNLFFKTKAPQDVAGGALKSYNDCFTSCIGAMTGTIVTDKTTPVSNSCKFSYRNIDYSRFELDSTLSYIPNNNYTLQTDLTEARKYIYAYNGTMNATVKTPSEVTMKDFSVITALGATATQIESLPYEAAPGKIGKTIYAFTVNAPVTIELASTGGILINEAGVALVSENGTTATLPAGTYAVIPNNFGNKGFTAGDFKEMTITKLAINAGDPNAHYHNYKLTKTEDATCKKEGYQLYECSCGDFYKVTLKKLSHNLSVTERVDSTCTEAGYEKGTCSLCGDVQTNVLEKAPHSYNWVITKNATETEKGSKTGTCSVCGDITVEEIPVLSGGMVHNFTEHGTKSTFYTISGNLSTGKGSVQYNGMDLTQALKIESSTSISFTAASKGKLTIVFNASASKNTIKVDGTKYTADSKGILVVDLESGAHTITKADSTNIFYLAFVYEGAEAPTEESTEAPTEESTEAPTEASTEAPTEESTEAPTEESTEAPTEESTEAPTEESTEAPTEESTEAPTEESTEAPTEESTEAPTEESTEASSEPGEEAGAVAGAITSYINASNAVTVALIKDGAVVYQTTSTNGNYSFANVAAGTYTLRVSKANHVTREYTVTVTDGTVTQAVKICPVGDVNGDGKISTIDVAMAYAHLSGANTLTGYKLECANVVGADLKITASDVSRIYAHAQGVSSLW